MRKVISVVLTALWLIQGMSIPVQARGRRPDPEDGYPDYNKLDMRRKVQEPVQEEPPLKAQDLPHSLPGSPPLNAPGKGAPEDDTVPQAPPKAVYMPDDASEPPLPDAIKDTLIQGTTAQ